MKRLSPAARKTIQRQQKDVEEFIRANPTDAALWPNLFEAWIKSRKWKKKIT